MSFRAVLEVQETHEARCPHVKVDKYMGDGAPACLARFPQPTAPVRARFIYRERACRVVTYSIGVGVRVQDVLMADGAEFLMMSSNSTGYFTTKGKHTAHCITSDYTIL